MQRTERRLWVVGALLFLVLVAVLSFLLGQALAASRERNAAPGEGETAGNGDATIGSVAGEPIRMSDFYDYAIRYYGASIIRHMTDMKIVELEAKEAGIAISDRDIRLELLRMQRGYESEQEFYDTMFEQLGLTKLQLEADIRQRLLLERVAVHNIHVSDEELDAYLESFPDLLLSLTEYQLHTLIVPPDIARTVSAQLAEGADFVETAMQHDTGDRLWSGDLGWVEASDPFVPYEILEAARSMQVGDVVRDIELADGDVAFVWLKGRKLPTAEEREAAMEQLRLELALSRAPSIPELLRRLREKWNVELTHPDFSIDNPLRR